MQQKIVFTLHSEGNLGCFPQCVAVDLDEKGAFNTHFTTINEQNKSNFWELLDSTDKELLQCCLKLDKQVIVSKIKDRKTQDWENLLLNYFSNKNLTPDKKYIKDYLLEYIEANQNHFFDLIGNKELYLPVGRFPFTWKSVRMEEEMPELLYCFENEPERIQYSLQITLDNKKLSLFKALLLSRKKARILIKQTIYEFENDVDGAKLVPFINKATMSISQANAKEYIHKVIVPLSKTNKVVAKGFEIETLNSIDNAVIKVREQMPIRQITLFDDELDDNVAERSVVIELIFEYGIFQFWAERSGKTTQVTFSEQTFCISKVERATDSENAYINSLKEIGLNLNGKVCKFPYYDGIEWINEHYKELELAGFEIRFENINKNEQQVFVGERTLKIVLDEGRDWFDLRGKVMFGTYEIPFIRLLHYIKQDKHQLVLPNGDYASIPQAWFDEYKSLADVCQLDDNKATLSRHYISLVKDFAHKPNLDCHFKANTRILLEKKTSEYANYDLPKGFHGELRHYQQQGYNWLRLLNEMQLGACLADDMGLGKTIQTLCLLQWAKEQKQGKSLLVVPKSLIDNWETEASQFTPQLNLYVHTGMLRTKNAQDFENADVIITNYSIIRRDKILFGELHFNYIVLDEAQAIKNPQSDTAQTCHSLKAAHYLTLTGTPLENSLTDLWSQVQFFNRNMLGTQAHFTKACKNTDKQLFYRRLLQPFMLRRLKKEVLTELPEKTITVQWCKMSEQQHEYYKTIRNSYRDKFLELKDARNKISAMALLEGLLRLRQASNHPLLIDKAYPYDSGKFDAVCEKIQEVAHQNDKVLIFSSFTEHLKLYRTYLCEANITYCYLDGSTKDRKEQVTRFQNDPEITVFLLSLKAGGVGLNLTAASYVFLLDPWWNPAAEAQAYDRAHRIGQKNKVFVYKFISKNTIEEKILKLQAEKLALFDNMINKTENELLQNLNIDDVMKLIE
ncbi:MAG: hypothetical protein AUK44_06465 [Porphyromonadaceae bacterium CG2_30_38_12]|nr:MAG: hypothetical protein AUK44_06465 [Porphyromonadaceae bacterium CG2_30_38_12]